MSLLQLRAHEPFQEFYLTASSSDDWDTSDDDSVEEPELTTYHNAPVYIKQSDVDYSPWTEDFPSEFYLTASPADAPDYAFKPDQTVHLFAADPDDLVEWWDTDSNKGAKFAPLRECLICCRDDIPIDEWPRWSPTDRCRHDPMSCRECLSTHIDSHLATHGALVEIPCPDADCGQSMVYEEVKLWASVTGFERYDTLVLRLLLSGEVNFVWCKNGKCDHGQIHAQGNCQPIVVCSQCKHKSCFHHQVPWHEGYTCSEYDNKMADPANQAKSAELIGQITKPCPKCQWPIQKNEGCEHMTCRCKYEFCWVCLASHKDIIRYGNHRHKPNCRLYFPAPPGHRD